MDAFELLIRASVARAEETDASASSNSASSNSNGSPTFSPRNAGKVFDYRNHLKLLGTSLGI